MPTADRPPYFEFWPRDFLSDPAVDSMTNEELGAFTRLLCRAWDRDHPGVLPDDDEELANLARVDPLRWQCVRIAVARAFEVRDGRWTQKRMVREAIKLCERIDKRAKSATKAAYARWMKHANAMRTPCDSMPSTDHRPPTRSKTPYSPPKGDVKAFELKADLEREKRVAAEKLPFLQSDVDDIYAAYPRHVGCQAARKAIGRALITIHGRNGVEDCAAWLLERVRAFAKSPAGNDGKYTAHPATWFNAGRYDDDESEWNRPRDNGKPETMTAAYRSGKTDYGAICDAKAIMAGKPKLEGK